MNRTDDLIRREAAPAGALAREDLAPGVHEPGRPRAYWTPYPTIAALMRALARAAPLCGACMRCAQDSTVFGTAVARCVASGGTLPETEVAFGSAGLRLPTTGAEARNVWAELARRYEADTGRKAPPVAELAAALARLGAGGGAR